MLKKTNKLIGFAAGWILFLSSCSKPIHAPALTQESLALKAAYPFSLKSSLQNWQLAGKMFVKLKLPKQTEPKSIFCYLDWRKTGLQSYLNLRSAFNLHSIVIQVMHNPELGFSHQLTQNSASFKIIPQARSEAEKIANMEKKIAKAIHALNLDLTDLSYWILGNPNPCKSYAKLTNGRSNGYTQAGWNIEYANYIIKPYLNTKISLPTKITLTNQQNMLKIVITELKLFP